MQVRPSSGLGDPCLPCPAACQKPCSSEGGDSTPPGLTFWLPLVSRCPFERTPERKPQEQLPQMPSSQPQTTGQEVLMGHSTRPDLGSSLFSFPPETPWNTRNPPQYFLQIFSSWPAAVWAYLLCHKTASFKKPSRIHIYAFFLKGKLEEWRF